MDPASAPSKDVKALWQQLWPHSRFVEPLCFRRAPLLAAALCFAVGIVAARYWRPASLLLLGGAVLGAIAIVALRYSLRTAIVPVLSLWLLLGWCCAEMEPLPSSQQNVTLLHYADGLSRQVHGRVLRIHPLPAERGPGDTPNDPDEWEVAGQSALATVDLGLDSIEDVTPDVSRIVPISGGIRITVFDGVPDLHCGDVIDIPLRLREPVRYRDPGAWQYADYLLQQGIAAHASIAADHIVPSGHSNATLSCRLSAAQNWASDRLLSYVRSSLNQHSPRALRLTADDAGMLNAMLFGDRTRQQQRLRVGFERTGSFHLFVVSGLHVAFAAGALWWLFRRLRMGEVLATLTTITFTSGYAMLTGFGVPVQRSLAMASVFLVARLLSRDRSVLNALGAAMLFVLAVAPHALFDSSFQMTVLAIMAIGGIAIPLGEWSFLPWARTTRDIDAVWLDTGMPPPRAQLRVVLRLLGEPLGHIAVRIAGPRMARYARRFPASLVRAALWLCELALIGIVAEACMSLPMALYFHRATLFALPTNMLSVPLVAVVAPLALITFLGSLIGPWAAFIPGWITALLLHGITHIVGRVSSTRLADWRVPGPVAWVALLAAACIAIACWMSRRSRTWAMGAITMLALVPVLAIAPEPPHGHSGVLEVTALDVGQGDSLFVASPQGSTMLIDAGGPVGLAANAGRGTSSFDIGEEVVSPYLWSRQLRRLDVVVLTHAHSDHMGGMPAVLRNLRPRELWVSIDPGSETYHALLTEAAQLGIIVRHWHAGDTTTWGDTNVSVLAPEAAYANPGSPVNNDSLVLRLQYGLSSVLLEGDAETPSERTMLANNRIQPVTLLKVGHHGSLTSSTPEFLAAAQPQDAVVSVGRNNTFGHPRAEIIQRLADAHTHVFRTDLFGATTLLLHDDGRIEAEAATGVETPTNASN